MKYLYQATVNKSTEFHTCNEGKNLTTDLIKTEDLTTDLIKTEVKQTLTKVNEKPVNKFLEYQTGETSELNRRLIKAEVKKQLTDGDIEQIDFMREICNLYTTVYTERVIDIVNNNVLSLSDICLDFITNTMIAGFTSAEKAIFCEHDHTLSFNLINKKIADWGLQNTSISKDIKQRFDCVQLANKVQDQLDQNCDLHIIFEKIEVGVYTHEAWLGKIIPTKLIFMQKQYILDPKTKVYTATYTISHKYYIDLDKFLTTILLHPSISPEEHSRIADEKRTLLRARRQYGIQGSDNIYKYQLNLLPEINSMLGSKFQISDLNLIPTIFYKTGILSVTDPKLTPSIAKIARLQAVRLEAARLQAATDYHNLSSEHDMLNYVLNYERTIVAPSMPKFLFADPHLHMLVRRQVANREPNLIKYISRKCVDTLGQLCSSPMFLPLVGTIVFDQLISEPSEHSIWSCNIL